MYIIVNKCIILRSNTCIKSKCIDTVLVKMEIDAST